MNTPPTGLPVLSDERMAELETELFGRISAESVVRRPAARPHSRTWWTAAAAAAAVVIVAGVVGANLGGAPQGSTADAPWAADSGGAELGGGDVGVQSDESSATDGTASDATSSARQVVTTASVSLDVPDAVAAIDELARRVVALDGYVESSEFSGADVDVPGAEADAARAPSGAWVSVRVPADRLDGLLEDLDEVGDVTASSLQRQDVTEQAVDLDARVTALQSSVDRLLDLIVDASSTADLVAAESALTARQSELDALRAEQTLLRSQVAMSLLSVRLDVPAERVSADPDGFGDGLLTGWNTLVAAANGVVIGLGFLLPWLVVGAVLVALVLGYRALRRRRRRRVD